MDFNKIFFAELTFFDPPKFLTTTSTKNSIKKPVLILCYLALSRLFDFMKKVGSSKIESSLKVLKEK